MKITRFSLIFLISSLLSMAGFDLPKGVYTSENFAEGKARAISKNLPIVYVYTNKNSN